MQPRKEFRRYSDECQSMSALSKDPETKALWHGIAERWRLCARLAEEEDRRAIQSKTERQAHARRRIPQHLERRVGSG